MTPAPSWLIEMALGGASSVPRAAMKRDGRCAEKQHTFECECGCRRQTSGRPGAIRTPASCRSPSGAGRRYLMATHSNGRLCPAAPANSSVRSSYRSAWLSPSQGCAPGMVDPEPTCAAGLVEGRRGQPSTALARTSKDLDPPTVVELGGQGRSHDGQDAHRRRSSNSGSRKQLPGRLRLASKSRLLGPPRPRTTIVQPPRIPTPARKSTAGPATLRSGRTTSPQVHVVGKTAAHLGCRGSTKSSQQQRRARGVYHGLRRKRSAGHLDEFGFRFNRSQNPPRGLGARSASASHKCRTGPYRLQPMLMRTGSPCA